MSLSRFFTTAAFSLATVFLASPPALSVAEAPTAAPTSAKLPLHATSSSPTYLAITGLLADFPAGSTR